VVEAVVVADELLDDVGDEQAASRRVPTRARPTQVHALIAPERPIALLTPLCSTEGFVEGR
jgi:hypothetical protein